MEIDHLYDTIENANNAMPFENPIQNALFTAGAAAGYAVGLSKEAATGRESGDYGTEENLYTLGVGGFAGGSAGTVIDGMQELGKNVREYETELGSEETSAVAMGSALGAAAGGSSAEGIRRLLSE